MLGKYTPGIALSCSLCSRRWSLSDAFSLHKGRELAHTADVEWQHIKVGTHSLVIHKTSPDLFARGSNWTLDTEFCQWCGTLKAVKGPRVADLCSHSALLDDA